MCDVYFHQCSHPECGVELYLHLSDFDTRRDEIEVFCNAHIPEDLSDGVLFEVKDPGNKEFPEHDPGYSGKMFIRALTDNARDNWAGNDYNGNCKEIKIFGMNEEEEKAFLEEENHKVKIWIDEMNKAHKEGRLMEFIDKHREEKWRKRDESRRL